MDAIPTNVLVLVKAQLALRLVLAFFKVVVAKTGTIFYSTELSLATIKFAGTVLHDIYCTDRPHSA